MPYTLLSNSPVSGQIAWSDVHLVYDGVDYSITNGTTNKRFVYWLKSAPTVFQVADNLPALGPDDTVVFLNKNGIAINVLNATALEGDLVVPGTITSNAIATDAIDATHIKSDAILARHILAGEVTADKITISSLCALSANMGDLTSGTITVDQAGFIRGGASAYGSGTGFWMGYHSGAYKWRVGTPGSSGAEWDGNSFNVYGPDGSVTISSGVVDWAKISSKPTSLSGLNAAEGTKLSGIQSGATVGATLGTNLYHSGTPVATTDLLASWNKISSSNAATFFDANGLPGTYIQNLTADKILAGKLAVSQWISSNNYVAGSTGWAINANGSAEFRNVTVRGDVEASGLKAGVAMVGTANIQNLSVSGIKMSSAVVVTQTFYAGQTINFNSGFGRSPLVTVMSISQSGGTTLGAFIGSVFISVASNGTFSIANTSKRDTGEKIVNVPTTITFGYV